MMLPTPKNGKRNKGWIGTLARMLNDSGSVAMEFALLFPILIFILLATVEVFIYYGYYFNVLKVTQITADFIARQTVLTSGTMSGIFKASSKTMYPLSAAGMTFNVASVIPPANSPIVSWSCTGTSTLGQTGTAAGIYAPGITYPLSLLSKGTSTTLLTYNPSVIVVNVSYNFSSLLPVAILGPITSTVYLSPRTAAVLASPNCGG